MCVLGYIYMYARLRLDWVLVSFTNHCWVVTSKHLTIYLAICSQFDAAYCCQEQNK